MLIRTTNIVIKLNQSQVDYLNANIPGKEFSVADFVCDRCRLTVSNQIKKQNKSDGSSHSTTPLSSPDNSSHNPATFDSVSSSPMDVLDQNVQNSPPSDNRKRLRTRSVTFAYEEQGE